MNELLKKIAAEHGTPCFVYFLDALMERVGSLRETFGGRFRVSYAVKSNPNRTLLGCLRGQADRLDVSSGGELQRALEEGWQAKQISFTGPAKRQWELELSVREQIGELVLESPEEAEAADEAARAAGVRQRVAVRIAPKQLPPGFGVNMAGKPSQFGIDEEVLEQALTRLQKLPNLELVGFHAYSGTQCLDAGSIAENYEIFIDLFQRACAVCDLAPKVLVFGSGIGIPYYEKDEPVNLAEIAERINDPLDKLKADARFADTELILEVGRYIVGEAGIYLTGVINVKESRGSTIAICDGGMNHHLGACGHLGSVFHRNYRIFVVDGPGVDSEPIPQELVGPLCTTIDTLGHRVQLPALRAGNVIGIHCSGAYGLTASPIHFISHEPAKEILVESDGEAPRVRDISELGTTGKR